MARQYKQDVWQIAGPACGQYGIILVSDAIWIKPYAPPCVLLTKGIDAQQLPIKITDSMKARLLTIAACAMMGRRQRRARALGARRRRDVLPRRPRAAMPGGRLPMPPAGGATPRAVHSTATGGPSSGTTGAATSRRSSSSPTQHSTPNAPTPLGRYHHDAQFFLLNCRLSDMIIDSNIAYAYTDKVLDPCPGASALTTTDARAKGAGGVAHGQSRPRAGLPGVPRRDCPLDVRRQVGPREAHTRAVAGACLLTAMPAGTRERRRRRAGQAPWLRRHVAILWPHTPLSACGLLSGGGGTAVTPTLSSKGALRRCRSKRG